MAHSAIRMGEDTTRIEEMPTVTIAARSDGVFLFVKRTFDVVMALMACLVVAIPCAVIYVVIRSALCVSMLKRMARSGLINMIAAVQRWARFCGTLGSTSCLSY